MLTPTPGVVSPHSHLSHLYSHPCFGALPPEPWPLPRSSRDRCRMISRMLLARVSSVGAAFEVRVDDPTRLPFVVAAVLTHRCAGGTTALLGFAAAGMFSTSLGTEGSSPRRLASARTRAFGVVSSTALNAARRRDLPGPMVGTPLVVVPVWWLDEGDAPPSPPRATSRVVAGLTLGRAVSLCRPTAFAPGAVSASSAMSAARALARGTIFGAKVLLLNFFLPGHGDGAVHGVSRRSRTRVSRKNALERSNDS